MKQAEGVATDKRNLGKWIRLVFLLIISAQLSSGCGNDNMHGLDKNYPQQGVKLMTKNGSGDTLTITEPSEKEGSKILVNSIMRKLYDSSGKVSKHGIPEVFLDTTGKYTRTNKDGVWLSWKDYELCLKMKVSSEDALAFLLGHELSHWFLHHLSLKEKQTFFANPAEIVKPEEEYADLQGAWFAYRAGYRIIQPVPMFLESFYQLRSYHDLPYYAAFSERKKSAEKVCMQVEQLIELFQIANTMHFMPFPNEVLKVGHDALVHLDSLLPDMPELKNDLAASKIRLALGDPNGRTFDYAFPLEIDYNFLKKPKGNADAPFSSNQEQWLTEATRLLGDAIILKAGKPYPEAQINQLVIDVMKRQYRSLDNAASTKLALRPDFKLLQGIRLAQEGELKEAIQKIESIKGASGRRLQQLTDINLAILRDGKIEEKYHPEYGDQRLIKQLRVYLFDFEPVQNNGFYYYFTSSDSDKIKMGIVKNKGMSVKVLRKQFRGRPGQWDKIIPVYCKSSNGRGYLARVEGKTCIEVIVLETIQN